MARLCGVLWLAASLSVASAGTRPVAGTGFGETTALAFSPDGKTVWSAGLGGSVIRWDATTGARQADALAHPGGAHALALSADGKHIATAGADNLVKLWDSARLAVVRTFEGHRNEVVAVAFSPDGKMLASGGADKTIRLWDVATGKPLRHYHGHELKVTGLAFAPDGKLLASGGTASAVIPGFFVGATHGDEIHLWDPNTGKLVRKLPLRGLRVAFSPDGGSILASGSIITGTPVGKGVSIRGGAQVSLAPAYSGKESLTIKGQGDVGVFSADGKFLATAWGHRRHLGKFNIENEMRHRRVALWEVASGKEVMQLGEEAAPVVAFALDARRLAVGRADGSVVLLSLAPEAAPKRLKVSPQEFEKRWRELASEDPGVAYRALWELASAGDWVAGLLGERLQPLPPAGAQFKELLAKLDSKRFNVREGAFRELKSLGSRIEGDLRQALRGRPSAEVRGRLETLLGLCARHPATPEELRQTRALQILERLRCKDAQAVLARLASGAPGAWLTVEAQLALRRLEKRMAP